MSAGEWVKCGDDIGNGSCDFEAVCEWWKGPTPCSADTSYDLDLGGVGAWRTDIDAEVAPDDKLEIAAVVGVRIVLLLLLVDNAGDVAIVVLGTSSWVEI